MSRAQRSETFTPRLATRKGWRAAIRRVIKNNTPRREVEPLEVRWAPPEPGRGESKS